MAVGGAQSWPERYAMHMQTLSTPMCIAHPFCLHPGMLGEEELASLRSLTERLAVQLRRAGPLPGVAKIMAAILIARDGHGARAACRLIPGVPDEGAHAFVGTLARRVGMLLSTDMLLSTTSAAASSAAVSSAADSTAADSTAAGPMDLVSTAAVSFAVSSAVSCTSYPADPYADDPYAGFGSDSGSWAGLDSPTREPWFPEDSEEAEIREAQMRAACHAADRQKRARAEISTADAIACAARSGQMAGWQPSDEEPMVSLISDYEIKRLRTVVRNEQGLLDLNLIPSSQLALSQHTLERNLDLQHRQLSRAVATAAIAHAIRDYYLEQFPGLDRHV